MKPIQFCHIAPTNYLGAFEALYSDSDLLLAHIAEEDDDYTEYYRNHPKTTRILDNGVFELNKKGIEFDANKLIDIASEVKATHVVLPDYPNKVAQETIHAAKHWIRQFDQQGSTFKYVFVPQSKIGDITDFDRCVDWGADAYITGDVDIVALSILGVPNAINSKQKFQRTLARWKYLVDMPKRNPSLYEKLVAEQVQIHCLGLLDGPAEIQLIRELLRHHPFNIKSWDSSSAVWLGLNGMRYDDTATGIQAGKFEKEVEFSLPFSNNNIDKALWNMKHVNDLCRG